MQKLTEKQLDKALVDLATPNKALGLVSPSQSVSGFMQAFWPIIRAILLLWKKSFGLVKGKAWKKGIDIAIAAGDLAYSGV